MKIKNLKIFKKSSIKMRLCAVSLATMVAIIPMTSCSADYSKENSNTQHEQLINEETKKVFEKGEHIVSVPIPDPTIEVKQYDYYDGYKCVGLATSAYGQYGNSFGGACVLYVNEYPVECYSSDKDKNNIPVYNNFGTPIGFEKAINNSTSETKDFSAGEHIISIPISDPRNLNVQYKYYEGYEPIDIAVAGYGKYFSYFSGGAIMYMNTVPVRCKVTSYDENNKGQYLSFGTPIETEKVITK